MEMSTVLLFYRLFSIYPSFDIVFSVSLTITCELCGVDKTDANLIFYCIETRARVCDLTENGCYLATFVFSYIQYK